MNRLFVHLYAMVLTKKFLPDYLKKNPGVSIKKAKKALMATAKVAIYGHLLSSAIKKKLPS